MLKYFINIFTIVNFFICNIPIINSNSIDSNIIINNNTNLYIKSFDDKILYIGKSNLKDLYINFPVNNNFNTCEIIKINYNYISSYKIHKNHLYENKFCINDLILKKYDDHIKFNFNTYYNNKIFVNYTVENNIIKFYTLENNLELKRKLNVIDQTYNFTKYSDYYYMYIYYSLFLLTLISNYIFNKFNLLCNRINLRYFGIISIRSFIFIVLYTFFWLYFFIYSLLLKNLNEILYIQGIWITLNLASLIFPVTKNSILLIFFNIQYNEINHVHKYIAILCVISAIIKTIFVLVHKNFSYLFILQNMQTGGSPLAGTISSLGLILITIFTIPIIKQKFYEIFYYSHKILFFIVLLTGSLHYILVLFIILPSLILYLFDIIIRYKNTHKALYSHIKISGDENYNTSCMLINIEILKSIKTRPGSYFFICFKDISNFEWHPLSLIFQTNDILLFCAKNMGKNSWTDKLKQFDSQFLDKTENLKKRDVYLQGPYYHMTIDYEKNKFKNIFCVAGGIGITPIISIIQDIQSLILKNKLSKIEKIFLIWVIPHISLVSTFSSILNTFNEIVDINIYCTKKSDIIIDSYFNFHYTKPNMNNLIDEYINNYNINSKFTGLICCGPNSLSNDVIQICFKRGIEFSNENF